MTAKSRPLALTMGDPAGIAGEIAIKAWHAPDGHIVPQFAFIGDPNWLRSEARRIKSHTHIIEIASIHEVNSKFHEGIPVLPVFLSTPPIHGTPDQANASSVIKSIETAVSLARSGAALAIVTNPIHKATLYASGFKFPGHTEYLASLCAVARPIMMLVIDGLRVAPVTVHLSLANAIRALNTDDIIETVRAVHNALRTDFNIQNPRLAIAALNPHAGENGTMGDEEVTIIAPAIAKLKSENISVLGPIPADTLFHRAARDRYDAAICMYHDQALIPLKTLDFERGVNVTLGLPITRTSPDHGTAFDIAGKGIASPASLLAALRLAEQIGLHRTAAL
jgi:4-hydroxythreonine-4-phosphate dehydrogenase